MASPPNQPPDSSHLHDDLQAEYFKLVELATGFDQRLVTIKGWGVTLSLASLGVGFQQGHYGLFLVAAVSAVAFWVIEGATKGHQMRYYPRMRDIEVAAFNLYRADTKDGPVSSPLLDWSWDSAVSFEGAPSEAGRNRPAPRPADRGWKRLRPFVFPHVVFPHVIAFATGTVLFLIGLSGRLGPI